MGFWLVLFTLKNGEKGHMTVAAVNEYMALDVFYQMAREEEWDVKSAKASPIPDDEGE